MTQRTSPAVILLLGAIAAGVAVIAVVLLRGQGADADREEERQARAEFEGRYFTDCTYGLTAPRNSPRYNTCAAEAVEDLLAEWEEADRPDPATIE